MADPFAENMFWCPHGICAYVNESRYGLRRHQAWCKYNKVRDSGKIGEGFVLKPSVKLGTTSDYFEYLSFCSSKKFVTCMMEFVVEVVRGVRNRKL